METEPIPFEAWMCRICLGQGRYSIFEDHLLPSQTEEEISTAIKSTTALQGQVTIVDALNYICEFKISPSEITHEPTMLCEGCCAALLQAYRFRIKLNEAEQTLLRLRDPSPDTCSTKTGLTLQLDEIEPFLDDPSPISEDVVPLAKTKPKIHHAKPRFQLTNQVSNILRHVAASSGGCEKRKEPSALDSSTPKKIQRRNEEDCGRLLNKTLIVPNYIFASELQDGSRQDKDILPVEPPSSLTSSETPESEMLEHQKSTHHLKHLPTMTDRNRRVREEQKTSSKTRTDLRRTLPAHGFILQQEQVPTRPEAIPATGDRGPPEGNK